MHARFWQKRLLKHRGRRKPKCAFFDILYSIQIHFFPGLKITPIQISKNVCYFCDLVWVPKYICTQTHINACMFRLALAHIHRSKCIIFLIKRLIKFTLAKSHDKLCLLPYRQYEFKESYTNRQDGISELHLTICKPCLIFKTNNLTFV